MINWITKDRSRKTTNADVMITSSKCRNSNQYRFGFNNFSYRRFSGGYIMLAKYKNRIYFKSTDEKLGFKLTDFSKDNSRCAFKAHLSEMDNYLGEHQLQFDDSEKLWYVEVGK